MGERRLESRKKFPFLFSYSIFKNIYLKWFMYDFSLSLKKSNLKDTYILTLLSQCLHKRKGFSKIDPGRVRYSRGGDRHRRGSGTDLGFNHLHLGRSPLRSPYLRSSFIQRHRTFGAKRESRR